MFANRRRWTRLRVGLEFVVISGPSRTSGRTAPSGGPFMAHEVGAGWSLTNSDGTAATAPILVPVFMTAFRVSALGLNPAALLYIVTTGATLGSPCCPRPDPPPWRPGAEINLGGES